jgi:NADPH:quinone reductase-like Zn-dependent oxidoreductase
MSQVTKSRAAGSHHTSPGSLPAVVGIDGVGRNQDGRRVYFVMPKEPFGGMAEKVAVTLQQCIPLPDDVDDITASAIAIPGMSSWAAFKERAHLIAGENVLINGATGAAGRLAVQIAKYWGARKVIATGRNVAALEQVKALGADVAIPLIQSPKELETAFKEQFGGDGVDVVLDYLWGKSAEILIVAAAKAGKDAVPIRFFQIGAVSGGDITLPGAALRSSALVLMGSGIGSIPLEGLIGAIGGVLNAVVRGKCRRNMEQRKRQLTRRLHREAEFASALLTVISLGKPFKDMRSGVISSRDCRILRGIQGQIGNVDTIVERRNRCSRDETL